MKTRYISLFLLGTILLLNACSPLAVVSSSGEQPTPGEEYDNAQAAYQPITVEDVQVDVGVGSPIPVHVIVSGSLPDVCSQVEHTEIRQDGSSFVITLSATPAEQGCVQDTLPFKIGIPLNVVDLPAGSYSVTVNGVSDDFELDTANSTASLWTTGMPVVRQDISVDGLSFDFGAGLPKPVHAIVSGTLPSACAQLGEVRVHRDKKTFFIRLVAYLPAQMDCNPDMLPFRLEIPLNIANSGAGPYEVNVNGAVGGFDHDTVPAAPVEAVTEGNLIPVENVEVQVGTGSPPPVEIVASGTWPDLCAQISEVQSRIDGFQVDITILASTANACPPDRLGLPFRFAIPLNIVEMEAGTYTATVNGASTTFEIPVLPQ